jgi:hypothetical protein
MNSVYNETLDLSKIKPSKKSSIHKNNTLSANKNCYLHVVVQDVKGFDLISIGGPLIMLPKELTDDENNNFTLKISFTNAIFAFLTTKANDHHKSNKGLFSMKIKELDFAASTLFREPFDPMMFKDCEITMLSVFRFENTTIRRNYWEFADVKLTPEALDRCFVRLCRMSLKRNHSKSISLAILAK